MAHGTTYQKDEAKTLLDETAKALGQSGVDQNFVTQLCWAAVSGNMEQAIEQLMGRLVVAAYLAGFAKGWLAKYENSDVDI